MKEKVFAICGTIDPLSLILSGGDVRRYHNEGYIRQQPVSEHTWRMLVILLHFWPEASRDLILTALYHDVAERYTGDIPATVKYGNPELMSIVEKLEEDFLKFLDLPIGKLSTHNKNRLKCADYIELCITCREQFGIGTHRAQEIYERGMAIVFKYAARLPKEERENIDTFMKTL